MANTTDGFEAVANTKCFLLTKMPLEIRLSIYRYLSAGSMLLFTLCSDPLSASCLPAITSFPWYADRSTQRAELSSTKRQFYSKIQVVGKWLTS